VRSDAGELTLNIPRDRKSEYKPQLIPKGRTTISGIDDKIISMYALRYEFKRYCPHFVAGLSLRSDEKQVKQMYDVKMSDSLLSRIIDKVMPEIKEWPI